MSGDWTHKLAHPITLPEGKVIEALTFPRMKGKWMRQFSVRASASGTADVQYEHLMAMGQRMLADSLGTITAQIVFDEMDPEDVHEVVGALGERFAGGQTTGRTA